MSAIDPWHDLQVKFISSLVRLSASTWFSLWRLFLDDAWFRAELAKHARSVLRIRGLPLEWHEDVQQEAMLLLANKLRKLPSLGLDQDGLYQKFPHSIGVIIRNECRQATKRLRRLYRSGSRLPHDTGFPSTLPLSATDGQWLEVSLAIDELGDRERSVLRLCQLGCPIQEVADRLGLTYWEAYRAYGRGIAQLRDQFGPA